ncbi:MAG: DUF1571 domain-containing protein [Planctomycetaceae bacterium]|nr:DUF1571 domain-containing protein [Planctomycetaceae bacterium]
MYGRQRALLNLAEGSLRRGGQWWLCVALAGAFGLSLNSSYAADPVVDPQHPLAPALEHAYKARETLKQVADYEAVFSKREIVGRKAVESTMRIKFRKEPYSVYMIFLKPHEGREVIYVEGRNNGKLLAHETGIRSIAGTVSLATDSEDAMEDNRYPITMIGMHYMLDRLIEQWEMESQYGEVDVQYYPNAKLGASTTCKVIESKHPKPRRQFRFHMTRLFLDNATGYPIRLEQLAFPEGNGKPLMVEAYTYLDVKVNLGLKDRDFDHTNPNYAFPR